MTRRTGALLAAGLLFPAVAAACGLGEQTPAGYENATVAHAHDHWRQGASSPIPFLFVDVRTPEEYAAGHIPGAVLIPFDELEARIGEVPRDRRVYLYCRSGARSARAAALLASRGYDNVENVVGGVLVWREAGYPLRPGAAP